MTIFTHDAIVKRAINHGMRLLILGMAIATGIVIGQKTNVDIESLMSATEFRKAGLQKLTPDELAALNGWLTQFAVRLYSARDADAAPAANTIETQIDSDFEGWSGDTIFKLANGQIWQQSSYAYTYHYAYRPHVIIYKSGSGYRMKVDEMEDAIAVKRLR
jgi:hypothetical protein